MKNRLIAFSTHIIASIVISLIAFLIVFFVWYPAPLDHAFNVSSVFFLLLVVNIIVGPILTFLVYQPKKKSLVFDLSVIVLLQIAAFGYGLHAIFQGRPAFVVFNQDRFEAIRTPDISLESKKIALANGNKLAVASWTRPRWVAATRAKDSNRSNEILFSALRGGPDWPQLPELYTPLIEESPRMLEKAKSLQVLKTVYQEHGLNLPDQLEIYLTAKVRWLPLVGKIKNMIVLIDAQSGNTIAVLDVDPYLQ
jgi:hypothetical protein